MIDSLYKKEQDAFWDRLGRIVFRLGIGANTVTLSAFAMSVGNSVFFMVHQNLLAYGIALAATELLDNLDGAVARVSDRKTRYGAFLDAVTDRYKETLSLFAVAWVTGYWIVAFAAVAGSLLVSYNQARAVMEGAPASSSGIDLFERFERVATLVLGLVLSLYLPAGVFFGRDALYGSLILIAVFSHVTALQRLLRFLRVLRALDRSSSSRRDG